MVEVAMSASFETGLPMEGNDFSYRPVPPLAVMSLITSILGISSLLTEFALPLSMVGCVLSMLCLRQFARNPNELSGRPLPIIGLAVSSLCLMGGSALHAYTYATELPDGFRRVNFTADISKKGFVETEGKPDFHGDVRELDGQQVFIKGFMYPEGKVDGIRKFLLVRDSGTCCFGGQPALNDMIHVVMKEGAADATYSQAMVAVGGVFKLGDLRRAGSLTPAYEIEATHFGVAKKRY